MKALATRFVREESGQDLIEYALLGGIIVAVTALAITGVGNKTLGLYNAMCMAAFGANC